MDPTTLSEEEIEDARRREDLDRQREEGKKVFEREVSERVDRLRSHLKDVKGDLMGPGEFSHSPILVGYGRFGWWGGFRWPFARI